MVSWLGGFWGIDVMGDGWWMMGFDGVGEVW